MTNNDDLTLKLKAAAEKIDRGEMLDLWLRMVEASARGHKKVNMALLDEAITAMNTLMEMEKGYVLALLAERDADKKVIAEQDARLIEYAQIAAGYAHRIDELEARTVSVKLPENIPCLTAPEIIWLQTNGVDDEESKWPDNSNDVTWCWEQMFNNDTLYVRADLAAGIKLDVGGVRHADNH